MRGASPYTTVLLLFLATALAAQAPPAEDTPVLGAAAAFDLSGERAADILLPSGARLFVDPAFRAQLHRRFVEETPVVLLEEHPSGWAKVRYGDFTGWTPRDGAASADPSYRTPPADARRLELARSHLGPGARQGRLGPYLLYTDVGDDELLASLDRVAARLPGLFRDTFGLEPVPGEGEAVVLFAEAASYRAYAARIGDPQIEKTGGHAGDGVAAVQWIEDRDALRRVVVHEIVHLLAGSVLPSGLPPWLGEGLAEALSYNRADDDGRLVPGTLDGNRQELHRRRAYVQEGGVVVEDVTRHELFGPLSGLSYLLEATAQDRLPPLSRLLWITKLELPELDLNRGFYPHSGFFMRYLLDGEDGTLRPALLSFLEDVARGGPANGAVLVERLGTDWVALEDGFRASLSTAGCVHKLPAAGGCARANKKKENTGRQRRWKKAQEN